MTDLTRKNHLNSIWRKINSNENVSQQPGQQKINNNNKEELQVPKWNCGCANAGCLLENEDETDSISPSFK